MTLYDYEDLVMELERGVVPAWFAAETAGRLRAFLTYAQLVQLAADQAYDQMDSKDWHPECMTAVHDLQGRCDRVGDGQTARD